VLAPFWTDLDGTGAAGIYAGILENTATGDRWLVVEWQANIAGTTSNRHFQVWLGLNHAQDVSFVYDPAARPADPNGQEFLVGAENEAGQGDVEAVLPSSDLVVASTHPTPGGSVRYTVTLRGRRSNTGTVTTEMVAADVPGVTIVESFVDVTTR
jgi:hypothetical protein